MKFYRLLLVLSVFLFSFSYVYAESTSSTGRGNGLDRTASALALHQLNLQRLGGALTGLQPRALKDQGNVSVMQDDGTLIVPLNRFDLSNRSVTFTPRTSGYQVISGPTGYESVAGSVINLNLDDDDTYQLNLPFPFTFYGVNYNSVYVNTDGNLTFGISDTAHTERDLHRVVDGPPRIAPLLDDLLPSRTGFVSITKFADRVRVDWNSISEYGRRQTSTFQVILNASGVIQFNYLSVNITGGVVALSPGKSSPLQTMDFSQQTSSTTITGIVAEVFSNVEELDLTSISASFLQTHRDAYDALFIFSDFTLDLGNAFAYEIPVRNDIQGIMPGYGSFDYGSDYGSAGRLSSLVNAGAISNYVTDPQEIFLGTNNTLDILGQEFGHRWLAYIDTSPSSMLGRDMAHWSFFMNTEGSVMEGNQIQDLGNNTFRTIGATFRYSPLDQYIMGLRDTTEVPPWFVVANPRMLSAPPGFTCTTFVASCAPAVGVEFSGTRRDLTINNVISIAGARVPSAANSQKDFSVAFILITRQGQEANGKSITHIENVRRQWEQFFVSAVDGRATMTTSLLYPLTTRMQVSIPANGSTDLESVASGSTQVGYGTLEQGFGVAVLRSFSGPKLIAEAAVPAMPAASHWVMYAEKAAALSTGVAIANPNGVPANLTLRLNDGRQANIQLAAKNHRAAFVEELLGVSEPFLGVLTIDSDVNVAVVALRGSISASGDFIMTTIPMTSAPPSTDTVAFPIIADGGTYKTEIILVNSDSAPSMGAIRFSPGNEVSFSIAPGSVWKYQTPGTGPDVISGSATLRTDSGATPDAVAIIRFSSAAGLISETGVPAQHLLTRGLMFGSMDTNLRTGLAILNPSATPVNIQLTARNSDGTIATAGSVSLDPSGRISAFLDEMIPGFASSFHGTVTLESDGPVYAVSIRGTTIENGGFVMSTVPIMDANQSVAATGYFPQIATGSAFTTEFLVADSVSTTFSLTFTSSSGDPLSLALKNWFPGN